MEFHASTVTARETKARGTLPPPTRTRQSRGMSRLETVRVELESAKAEIHRLESENACFQQQVSEARAESEGVRRSLTAAEAERLELAEECARTKALYEGLLTETQHEQDKAAAEAGELHQKIESLSAEQGGLEREATEWERRALELRTEREAMQERQELELLRALEKEKSKWEAREDRLTALTEQLHGQFASRPPQARPPPPASAAQRRVQFTPDPYQPTPSHQEPQSHTKVISMVTAAEGGASTTRAGGVPTTAGGGEEASGGEVGGGAGGCGGEGEGSGGYGFGGGERGGFGDRRQLDSNDCMTVPTAPLPALYLQLVAHQLPPLAKFTGDTSGEAETVVEWLEQFELIANACHWNESAKLVNLVTRLKGQAFAFYRSCDPQKRNNYAILREELKKRFTPVHIQAVQSSLFHDRKQAPGENVDMYAQDLKCLFYRAYPSTQQSTMEMQEMARSVLTNQFVSGLQFTLKGKLAGKEGQFEQLLTLARFEEAKMRELCPSTAMPRKNTGPPAHTQAKGGESTRESARTTDNQTLARDASLRCFECGRQGQLPRPRPAPSEGNTGWKQELGFEEEVTLRSYRPGGPPRNDEE